MIVKKIKSSDLEVIPYKHYNQPQKRSNAFKRSKDWSMFIPRIFCGNDVCIVSCAFWSFLCNTKASIDMLMRCNTFKDLKLIKTLFLQQQPRLSCPFKLPFNLILVLPLNCHVNINSNCVGSKWHQTYVTLECLIF